jgi:hypothetical protein
VRLFSRFFFIIFHKMSVMLLKHALGCELHTFSYAFMHRVDFCLCSSLLVRMCMALLFVPCGPHRVPSTCCDLTMYASRAHMRDDWMDCCSYDVVTQDRPVLCVCVCVCGRCCVKLMMMPLPMMGRLTFEKVNDCFSGMYALCMHQWFAFSVPCCVQPERSMSKHDRSLHAFSPHCFLLLGSRWNESLYVVMLSRNAMWVIDAH